jgi:hypothetical protein
VSSVWLKMCLDGKEALLPPPSIIAGTMLSDSNIQDGGVTRMAAILASGCSLPLESYFVFICKTDNNVQLLVDLAEAAGAEVSKRTTYILLRSAI